MQNKYFNLFLCSLISSSSVYASGFNIKLNSGILAGQANAGSAVISDPLAILNNPASAIQQCNIGIAVQGTGLFPYARFKGKTTNPLASTVLGSSNSRQAAQNAIVPSGAVVGRVHDRLALGIIMSSPFGSKLNYGKKWGGNRYVIKAGLETINMTPTVAIKLDEKLSIGGGLQIQYAKALLSTQSSSSNPVAQFLLQRAGTRSKANVHGWGAGWTAGLLFQPFSPLKIGFSYRSAISTSPKGYLTFRNVPSQLSTRPSLQNTSAKTKIKFPGMFTLSGSYDITPQWTALFDVIRTNWSSVRQIVLSTPVNSQASLNQLKWKDTWFFSTGVNYQYDSCWLFRAGIAYDAKASRTPYRAPGLPDSDKIWTALGITYSWNEKLSTSLSYGHEFFKKQRINLRNANPGNEGKGNLTGHIREHVDLVSLQLNYQF